MTTQSRLQSWQERKTLFAQGRHIATNAAKSLCSRQTAETARHLLLHFHHAQIPLGQIVVKIHPQIFQEAEDRFLVFAQPVEQGACGTLFDSPLGSRGGRRSWSDSIPFIKQAEKRGFPIKHFQRIEPALSLFACLLGGLFHREEQVFEIGRPDGSLLLCLKHQLSEEMNQAEGMLACIQKVRSPGIMDADAREDGQDANRVQSVLSSATIHMIMGEGCRTGDMLPVSLPSHRHARFVLMKNGGLDQRLFDLLLDGGRYCCRERGQREVLTAGTLLLFCSVFLHDQPGRWHVHHLPTKRDTRLDLAQIVLTGRAHAYQMLNHFIWRLRKPQGRSRVSLLPSGLLLALCAQAFWLPHKAIRGGGQAAIVAVFRQPILQVFHLLGQSRNLFLHLLHQQALLAEQGFLLLDSCITLCHLFTQALIFFFTGHACTLLGFTTFGKSPADLGSYVIY